MVREIEACDLHISVVGGRGSEQVRVLLRDIGVVGANNGSTQWSPNRVERAGERRIPNRVIGVEADNRTALRGRNDGFG